MQDEVLFVEAFARRAHSRPCKPACIGWAGSKVEQWAAKGRRNPFVYIDLKLDHGVEMMTEAGAGTRLICRPAYLSMR
jgi:hypothetical protein